MFMSRSRAKGRFFSKFNKIKTYKYYIYVRPHTNITFIYI